MGTVLGMQYCTSPHVSNKQVGHLFCALVSCRLYEFPAVGTTPGDKTATVKLTQPDSNPANDQDNAVTTLWVVCGNPYGNGTQPACPAPASYVGPAVKPISAPTYFTTMCCVSTMKTVVGHCSVLTVGLNHTLCILLFLHAVAHQVLSASSYSSFLHALKQGALHVDWRQCRPWWTEPSIWK